MKPHETLKVLSNNSPKVTLLDQNESGNSGAPDSGSFGKRSMSYSKYLTLMRQAGNVKNQISSQWPSYMTCKYSEFNNINEHRNLPENMLPGKNQNLNRKLGMSQDFPFKGSAHQQIYNGSKSIFSTEGSKIWKSN